MLALRPSGIPRQVHVDDLHRESGGESCRHEGADRGLAPIS